MASRTTFSFEHLGVHYRRCLCDVDKVTGKALYVGRPNFVISSWYFTGKETDERESPHFWTQRETRKAIAKLLATVDGVERVRDDIRRDIVRQVVFWNSAKAARPDLASQLDAEMHSKVQLLADKLAALEAYPRQRKRNPRLQSTF